MKEAKREGKNRENLSWLESKWAGLMAVGGACVCEEHENIESVVDVKTAHSWSLLTTWVCAVVPPLKLTFAAAELQLYIYPFPLPPSPNSIHSSTAESQRHQAGPKSLCSKPFQVF